MRAAEIKNNLRQADLQYKIDQANSKLKTAETKQAKNEEAHKKIKSQLED